MQSTIYGSLDDRDTFGERDPIQLPEFSSMDDMKEFWIILLVIVMLVSTLVVVTYFATGPSRRAQEALDARVFIVTLLKPDGSAFASYDVVSKNVKSSTSSISFPGVNWVGSYTMALKAEK